MKLCIHRGSHQIGGSCVELEAQGRRLLLDLGLPLDAPENTSSLLPGVPGMLEPSEDLLGVVVSHPHPDHYGLLKHIRPDLPVAMGAAGRRILEAAAPWVPNATVPPPGPTFQNRRPFTWGPFRITPYLVDHSAFDAYAFLVEAEGHRVFYSGDFRAHGRKAALFERMVAHPPKGLDVLLMEGSSLGRLDLDTTFETEDALQKRFQEAFDATAGLVLVYASAQNIDRVVTIFKAAKACRRRLVIDLYAAAILEATGVTSIPQSHWSRVDLYVPELQGRQIKARADFTLLHHHSVHRLNRDQLAAQAASSVLLFRPLLQRDLEAAGVLPGARLLYSMWEGYLREKNGLALQAWASGHEVPLVQLHTSGHAGPADLKRFAEALDPKVLVPIHSFHPDTYREFFPRVERHEDGVWWALPPV